MGKKAKAAKKNVATPTRPVDVARIESLESLLYRILVEYIQVSTTPSGKLLSGPVTTCTLEGQEEESIRLKPQCHYEAGCSQNFAEFFSTPYGMNKRTAFEWWCRSRLHFSCSHVVVAFGRFMVPHMKRMGIEELITTCIDGKTIIRLDDLDIYTLSFVPRKKHALVLDYGLTGPRTDVVEAMTFNLCSHNVLRCSKTGVIIDITLGQFLGTIKPYLFRNQEEFFASIPGVVVDFCKTDESLSTNKLSGAMIHWFPECHQISSQNASPSEFFAP